MVKLRLDKVNFFMPCIVSDISNRNMNNSIEELFSFFEQNEFRSIKNGQVRN